MWCCLFSSHKGFHLTAMTLQISSRVFWQLHQLIPSGLWDAYHQDSQTCGCSVFRFLRWSQTWSLLTVGGMSLPQPRPTKPNIWGFWYEQLSEKIEAKKLLSTSAFSLSAVTSMAVLLTSGAYSLLNFPFLVEVPVEGFLSLLATSCQV